MAYNCNHLKIQQLWSRKRRSILFTLHEMNKTESINFFHVFSEMGKWATNFMYVVYLMKETRSQTLNSVFSKSTQKSYLKNCLRCLIYLLLRNLSKIHNLNIPIIKSITIYILAYSVRILNLAACKHILSCKHPGNIRVIKPFTFELCCEINGTVTFKPKKKSIKIKLNLILAVASGLVTQ